jgi:prepilin signal peptidase PulO-like enzyme (type II secretory pathway)
MTMVFLVILGLGLGSFANALVWRIYQQYKGKKARKYSIVHGRSMCPNCQRSLSVKDLIPVFSWLGLKGKCRYCKKSISWQYPAVEVSTAVLFVLSYLLWPKELAGWEWLQLAIWLVCLTGFVALIVYDLRYMILPNRIIFPLMAIASGAAVIESVVTEGTEPISSAILGLLVGGGIFYLLFVISDGAWIGGGDVKLGFLLGLLVGGPANAFLMLFLASLLGTILFLPLLLGNKLSIKKKIPFGPFLIAGGIIAKLMGSTILDWYTNSLL